MKKFMDWLTNVLAPATMMFCAKIICHLFVLCIYVNTNNTKVNGYDLYKS